MTYHHPWHRQNLNFLTCLNLVNYDKLTPAIFILIISIGFSCAEKKHADEHDEDLQDFDYRLFKNTSLWELAQAVEGQDTLGIVRIVKETRPDINYQEPKYGNTLLMLTILNDHYYSAKTLLDLNANPNINNTYDGSTPLIEASEIDDLGTDNAVFIKLLLSRGADPNLAEAGSRLSDNAIRKTALLSACSDLSHSPSPEQKVKALVEAGANINYEDDFGHFPLGQALINKHYDVVLYLLEKGANYKKMIIDRSKFQNNGEKLYISNVLREHLFPLESEEHKMKMKIVSFLKEKDVNYEKAPIPDFVLKRAKADYPGSWQEYLRKY
jgi:ankyrin repeat protein